MAPQHRNRSRLTVAVVAAAAGLATYTAASQRSGAFLPPSANVDTSRREVLFGAAAGAATAVAAAPEIVSAGGGPKSSFGWAGIYTDPMHPNCKRTLTVDWSGLVVGLQTGPDGAKECNPQGTGGTTIKLKTKFKEGSDTLTIDFSPVGGPTEVAAKWEGKSSADNDIAFPDGNKWHKVNTYGAAIGPA
eukprot:TRINITY_DN4691_c0_g2_i1.p1 TRINITY_DN4691_c0_g2~~TRINITY_DN4691_c0_g2_i1.p1  ORF type:complete len:189 (-),score=40.95 TRINITY_DN4691_c0_g2_i1:144-710(-)